MCCRLRSIQVIGTDGENDGVVLLDRGIVVCQLDELNSAERSPERAVEDEHNVAMSSIRAQGIVVAACAW